jgi:hypothetical protein
VAGPSPGISKLAPRWVWALVALAAVLALLAFVGVIAWVPAHLVTQGRASDDAYLKAITDTRSALVQAAGGFAVFLGVLVGLFTLRHNRQQLLASRQEHVDSLAASRQALQDTLSFNRDSLDRTTELAERGLITERFSKGIEQLGRSGANDLDLRLGGVYALGEVARESAAWHNPVIEVLAAFVRVHASGQPAPEGATLREQRVKLYMMPIEERWLVMPADLAAALDVLSRRDRTKDIRKLDLSHVDFRRTPFPNRLDLQATSFAFARMQFTRLPYANLRESLFAATDLRGTSLLGTDLSGAHFFRAKLMEADFDTAQLDGAEFEECDLTGATNLTVDQLKVAKIDHETKLPDQINREALGQSAAVQPPPSS